MSNEIEKRKYEELKAMFEPEDFEFLQNNLDSDDPEVREKIAEIYARNNYFAKLFSNEYLLSEESLLDMAKKGPTQKAVAQTFLGRMIDNEGHWDVPDYRYPFLEVNKKESGTTNNDLLLSGLGWLRMGGYNEYTKFIDGNKYCLIHLNPDSESLTITKDGTSFELSYNDIFAILQKCRETGMSKPPTVDELFFGK